MREWLVAGAVIESPGGLLLVQNRRRDGRFDWSPPGGVIDPGESLVQGLTREVTEETGLLVTDWVGPLYEIEATAPELGWHLRVEVHQARAVTGELTVDDPDGIVVDACYAPDELCHQHLAPAPRWVREPLGEWLGQRWSQQRRFRYHIEGNDFSSLTVSALT